MDENKIKKLLESVKLSLRLKGAAFDELEIIPLIRACIADLERVGVDYPDAESPLIKQAVNLYCKAYFGFRDDAERFISTYEKLRDSIALSGWITYGELE